MLQAIILRQIETINHQVKEPLRKDPHGLQGNIKLVLRKEQQEKREQENGNESMNENVASTATKDSSD